MNKSTSLPGGVDLNTVLAPDIYYCGYTATFTNFPTVTNAFSLRVYQTRDNGVGLVQVFNPFHVNITYFRTYNIDMSPQWSDWALITTTTKPEEHALPLAEGWTAGRKTKFSVSQDSLVLVTFGVWGPANTSDRAVIAQLPPSFRPGELISTGCTVTDESTYTRYAAGLDVNRAGEVIVFSKQPGWSIAVGQVAFYTNV